MSKRPELDYVFNPVAFAELLKNAKGDRRQNEYAQECGLSTAYMNKYLNGSFDQPPTPATIQKLSMYASNNVSFEDLLRTAGYAPQKYVFHSTGNRLLKYTAIGFVTSKIYKIKKNNNGEDVEIHLSQDYNDFFDFAVSIFEPGGMALYFDWVFDICTDDKININEYINERVPKYVFSKSISDQETKISIITFDQSVRDLIDDFPRLHVTFALSVIILDKNTLKIEDERYILTDDRYKGFYDIPPITDIV